MLLFIRLIRQIIHRPTRLHWKIVDQVSRAMSVPATSYIPRTMMYTVILRLLTLSATLVALVDGHGMMTSPRSRNWLATPEQGGVGGPEYCTHCLNVNDP